MQCGSQHPMISDMAPMKKQKEKRICNLAQWKKYCQAFLWAGGALKNDDRISVSEYQIHFWKGIPKELRRKLEDWILAKEPLRPLKEPFNMDELDDAENAILQQDCFDTAFDDSDSEDESSKAEGYLPDEESSDSSNLESEG